MITRVKTIAVTAAAAALILSGCSQPGQAVKTRWDKTSAKFKLPIAGQQFAAGKYDDARKTLNEVLIADNSIAEAHLLNGKLLLAEKQDAKGFAEISFALQLNQNLSEAWYLLGLLAEEKNDLKTANEDFIKALTLEPANLRYISALISNYISLGDYSKPASYLESAMNSSPANARLKFLYAQLMQRQNRLNEALTYYRQAYTLLPDDLEIAEALGCCHILLANWSQGSEIFETLTKKAADPEKKMLFSQLAATCSMNLRKYNKAAKALDDIAIEQRENPQLWVKAGHAAFGQSSYQRALVCAQRALKLQPDFPQALALQGCAQFMTKDYLACQKSFEQLTADPDHRDFAWFMTGKCLQRQGEFISARKAFDNARQGSDKLLSEYLAKLTQ